MLVARRRKAGSAVKNGGPDGTVMVAVANEDDRLLGEKGSRRRWDLSQDPTPELGGVRGGTPTRLDGKLAGVEAGGQPG